MTLDLAGMRKAAMDGVASEDKGTVLFIKPTIVLALLDEIERTRILLREGMDIERKVRAENESLRKALQTIVRTPAMPFPDPLAHSERAFGEAVFRAWSSIQQTARAALATGQQESRP